MGIPMDNGARKSDGLGSRAARALRVPVIAALTVALTVPVGAREAAPITPDCSVLALSPGFDADGSGFCAGWVVVDVAAQRGEWRFYVTKDGGRAWARPAASGLAVPEQSRVDQIVVSPLYETDRTVFLHSTEGIWKTTDDGATFSLVNALANPGDGRLAPYVEPVGIPVAQSGEPHTAFAYANYEMTAKIDPPLHAPVAASPENETQFLLPRDFPNGPGFVFTQSTGGDAIGPVVSAWSCNGQLVCAEELHAFPAGYTLGYAWLGPLDEVYVELRPSPLLFDEPVPRMWRSVDGGQTFEAWDSLDDVLEPLHEQDLFAARVGIASHPKFPGRLFAYVTADPERSAGSVPPAPPGEQIFRSDDGGDSWRRVAWGLGFGQTGLPGTLPWNAHKRPERHAFIELTGNGRLFVQALQFGGESYEGPFCSISWGRAWARTCRR